MAILIEVFTDLPSFKERNATADIFEFPLFFGTTLFSLVAIGLVITLENNMKHPKSFSSTFGVLNCGMGFVTVLYIVFGLFGYVKYGDDIKDSITLNLDEKNVYGKTIFHKSI